MSVRQQKVAAQVKRIVSTLLTHEVQDPRVGGLLTVTKVEITPDLEIARVFISVLGQKGPLTTVMHGIESARGHIQKAVADALPIRRAPHLEFVLDDSIKKEAEMLRKIDEVMKESREGMGTGFSTEEASGDAGAEKGK